MSGARASLLALAALTLAATTPVVHAPGPTVTAAGMPTATHRTAPSDAVTRTDGALPRSTSAALRGTAAATTGPHPGVAPTPEPPGAAAGLRQIRGCTPLGTGGPGTTPQTITRPDAALATGADVLVAVIDTGVAPVPRLAGRVRGGGDYLAGGDGLDDCDGHGTDVALLLAGAADPGTPGTGAGMAPGSDLLSLRQSSSRYAVLGADGTERPAGEIRTLAAAIRRAVALGASVINVSEVVCVPADRLDETASDLRAAVREAARADVLVVAAAGNIDPSGTCTGAPSLRPLPALDDSVLAVGAVDAADRPAPFSVPGPWVDLAAPGVELPSPSHPDGPPVSGTSYAAPLVAGTAALLRQRFPMLTAEQVADRLRATARRPAAGRDDKVGDGVLDPVAALTAEPLLLSPGRGGSGVAGGPRTGAGDPSPGRIALPVQAPAPPELPAAAAVGALAAAVGTLAVVLAGLRRRPRRPDQSPHTMVMRGHGAPPPADRGPASHRHLHGREPHHLGVGGDRSGARHPDPRAPAGVDLDHPGAVAQRDRAVARNSH